MPHPLKLWPLALCPDFHVPSFFCHRNLGSPRHCSSLPSFFHQHNFWLIRRQLFAHLYLALPQGLNTFILHYLCRYVLVSLVQDILASWLRNSMFALPASILPSTVMCWVSRWLLCTDYELYLAWCGRFLLMSLSLCLMLFFTHWVLTAWGICLATHQWEPSLWCTH